CEAKADTIQTSPTGYGGGIFLTGSGYYDPSTQRLDLKGMNIYNNSAEIAGQSLYVEMINVKELCKYGIAGEYVKGNYSDRYSKFEDIQGISANLTTFNSLSFESIQQQQSPLQFYWLEISNLTKISATLNISNINQPLQINLEGYNIIEGQFSVKIVELGQITKDDTHQHNFIKLKLINNYAFEIIYPPDDGSSEPILIEGDPQSQQTASFGMKDISWYDYNNKHYGVFASNDRRIFTGIDGKQDEAYPLEYQFAVYTIAGESIKRRKIFKSTIFQIQIIKTVETKQK
ncbi:MAG: hypothetical protein EZS28_041871, partial [Streblomastix strix]